VSYYRVSSSINYWLTLSFLQSEKQHIHILGVALYTGGTGPLIVPLHEREGLIYRPMARTQEKHIVAPKFRDSSKELRAHWDWVGYPVYAWLLFDKDARKSAMLWYREMSLEGNLFLRGSSTCLSC